MKNVYSIYEENHGMVGIAVNYQSAIQGLIKEKWLSGDTELVDEDGNFFTIEEKFGENRLAEIKKWDISTFNSFFDGLFWISTEEIWDFN